MDHTRAARGPDQPTRPWQPPAALDADLRVLPYRPGHGAFPVLGPPGA